jgi:hypothetical protein
LIKKKLEVRFKEPFYFYEPFKSKLPI